MPGANIQACCLIQKNTLVVLLKCHLTDLTFFKYFCMDNFAVWNDAWEILNIRDSWVVIENGKKVIYYHFEKKHYVSKNDSSFESFSNLTRILGALEILQCQKQWTKKSS